MKFLRNFLAGICSIIIFCLVMMVSLVLITRDIFDTDSLEEIIEEANILGEHPDGLIDIREANQHLDSSSDLATTITYVSKKIGVDESLIKDIINDKEIEKVVISFVSKNADFLFTDSEKPTFDKAKVEAIIEDHIQKYNGENAVTDKQKEEIYKFFNLFTDNMDKLMPEKTEIEKGDVGLLFDFVKLANDPSTVPLLIVTIIVLMAVFGLLKGHIYHALKCGTPILISGIMLILTGVAGSFLNGFVAGDSVNILTSIINFIMSNVLDYGIVSLIIGIVLLIAHAIIKHLFFKEIDEEVQPVKVEKQKEEIEKIEKVKEDKVVNNQIKKDDKAIKNAKEDNKQPNKEKKEVKKETTSQKEKKDTVKKSAPKKDNKEDNKKQTSKNENKENKTKAKTTTSNNKKSTKQNNKKTSSTKTQKKSNTTKNINNNKKK